MRVSACHGRASAWAQANLSINSCPRQRSLFFFQALLEVFATHVSLQQHPAHLLGGLLQATTLGLPETLVDVNVDRLEVLILVRQAERDAACVRHATRPCDHRQATGMRPRDAQSTAHAQQQTHVAYRQAFVGAREPVRAQTGPKENLFVVDNNPNKLENIKSI